MTFFEGVKSVGANIMCIQEPYVSEGVLSYPAFNLRCGLVRKRKEQREAIGITVSPRWWLIVEALIR